MDSVWRLPIAKLWIRNRSRSSIGCSVRRSCSTNATISTTEASSDPATVGSDSPASGARTRPNVRAARPAAHCAAPAMSIGGWSSPRSPSGTTRATSSIVTSTSGTFSAKIQRHEAVSTSWPPINGPMTTPMAPQAVHEPTALPRSSRGNTITITASAAGDTSAPLTPWSARASTSTSIVGANAHRSEVSPKPISPAVNTRLSPRTSPSEPPTRISEANVIR